MEWMDKYRDAPRSKTALTIDRPMIVVLGMTAVEFAAGALVGIVVIARMESSLAFPVGLAGGVLTAWLAREYRLRTAPRFLQHWAWSLGKAVPGVPSFFEKRRHVRFGP